MSGLYGPVQINANTLTPVAISSQTVGLLIENRSFFDLFVSISVDQPQTFSFTTLEVVITAGQLISAGGWDLHIGPMTNGTMAVPTSALTDSPRGAYWTGTVWLFPSLMSNSESVTGVVEEPGDNVWITAYGPDEKIPEPGLSPAFLTPTVQNRNIEVPLGAVYNQVDNVTASAQNVWTNYGNAINLGDFPFNNPAIAIGAATAGLFAATVYDISLSMIALSAVAATAESQRVTLGFNVLDSSSASVGGLFGYYSVLLAHLSGESQASVDIAYPHPKIVTIPVVAGAGPPYTLRTVFIVDFAVGGGGTAVKEMVLNTGFDVAATVPAGIAGGLVGIPFVLQVAAGNPWSY